MKIARVFYTEVAFGSNTFNVNLLSLYYRNRSTENDYNMISSVYMYVNRCDGVVKQYSGFSGCIHVICTLSTNT